MPVLLAATTRDPEPLPAEVALKTAHLLPGDFDRSSRGSDSDPL